MPDPAHAEDGALPARTGCAPERSGPLAGPRSTHGSLTTAHAPAARATIACAALALATFTAGCTAKHDEGNATTAAGATGAAVATPAGSTTGAAATAGTPGTPPGAPTTATAADVTPANAGFAEPENLVYDSVADVYLVSNINGGPTARDANGFVTRIDAATGRVVAQKWIDGANAKTRLDGPKGIAIQGDTLVIADVGVVRRFDRRTGTALGAWQTPGELLNDVSFAPDRTLYVTNTRGGRDSSGAIYHFDHAGHASTLASGASLDGPDGIVALPDGGVMYATFGADRVARVAAGGATTRVATLPGKKVDGLRRMADGSFVVTSWDAHTVFHLLADGTLQPLLTGVTSPAGVAIDTRRNRLAVTSMQDNKLYFVSLH